MVGGIPGCESIRIRYSIYKELLQYFPHAHAWYAPRRGRGGGRRGQTVFGKVDMRGRGAR